MKVHHSHTQSLAPLPLQREREAILRKQTEAWDLLPGIDLAKVAEFVSGFTRQELVQLCHVAAKLAARDVRLQVTEADFNDAIEELLLQGARLLLWDADERRQVAYHEAGHALVAWLTPGSARITSISILPIPQHTQELERRWGKAPSASRLAELDVLLGGYVAEQLLFGVFTPYAVQDIIAATRLIRELRDPALSSATDAMDHEAELLEKRCRLIRNCLADQRSCLDKIANALFEEEQLEENGLEALLRTVPRGR